jgi:hypothetical protein
MSNHDSETSRTDRHKSPSEDPDAASIAPRRERLAKLLGRLLARHWLREKRPGTKPREEA